MYRDWKTLSELLEAARDGARLHKNSGRGVVEKGDASLDDVFCIDYKEYTESFGVSRNVWAKVTKDAQHMRMEPALKLVLGPEGPDGRELAKKPKTRLWVINDKMFHEMYETWKEKYGMEA